MQIIIPMAGSGQRFKDAGYKTIKPLILINNRPMVEYVVNFFPGEENFVFICSNEHLKDPQTSRKLKNIKPNAKITGIDFKPRHGVVHGVLWAEENISDNEPVIFTYCDYDIYWDYQAFKKFTETTNADGIILSYTGFHPHLYGPDFYAGVKTDSLSRILEIKEKHCYAANKMDGWHSCGLYYFKSGRLAKEYFKKHVQGPPHENGEYYISTVYNDLIKDDLDCLNYPLSYFCQWGTPEDLEEYNIWINRVKNHYQPANEKEEKIINYWTSFLNLKS